MKGLVPILGQVMGRRKKHALLISDTFKDVSTVVFARVVELGYQDGIKYFPNPVFPIARSRVNFRLGTLQSS